MIGWGELINRKTGRYYTLDELIAKIDKGKSDSIMTLYEEAAKIREELARPEKQKELAEWIAGIAGKIQKGVFHPRGERRIIGALDDSVLSFFKENEIKLATAAMSISDKDFIHALRTTKDNQLSIEVWRSIADILKNPENIYLDLQKPGLIYVIRYNQRYGKVIIQINHETKIKRRTEGKKKIILTNNVRTGKILTTLDEFQDHVRYAMIK